MSHVWRKNLGDEFGDIFPGKKKTGLFGTFRWVESTSRVHRKKMDGSLPPAVNEESKADRELELSHLAVLDPEKKKFERRIFPTKYM